MRGRDHTLLKKRYKYGANLAWPIAQTMNVTRRMYIKYK